MPSDLTGTLADLVSRRGMRALLLSGPRGSGKSSFVTLMRDEWLRQGGAVAYRDLSLVRLEDERDHAKAESAVQEVIARLAWDLRLDCRRLVASQVAMGLTLRSTDRAAARAKMLEEWLKYNGASDRWKKLADMAGGMAVQHLSPGLGNVTVQSSISDATSWVLHSVARKALPSTLRWFADPCTIQTRGKDARAALDALCNLSVNAAEADNVHAQRDITRVQLLALLADLASTWSSGASRHRTDQAVCLLDNVDTPIGRRFVATWNDVWTALQARRQADAVPLSLVATARSPVSAIPGNGLDGPADATPVHQPGTGHDPSSWQAIRIPALTRDEVQQRARQRLAGAIGELVGAVVHEATAGHRGATEVLLDPQLWVPGSNQPADVLASYLDGATVEDRLLESLLDPVLGPEVTDLLCCCAVAHCRAAAGALLPALVRPNDPMSPQVRQLLDTLPLWTESSGRPTLLRRLLLRRLARQENHERTWTRLHRRLIDGNVDQAYYLMGLENARAAASRLATELLAPGANLPSVKDWVRRLTDVAAAPRPTLLPPGLSAAEEAHALRRRVAAGGRAELAGYPDRDLPDPTAHKHKAVTEATYDLLPLLAVASDPFRAVPRGQLHRQVSACYQELERVLWQAGQHDQDGAFPRAIQTHMALDAHWRQLERTVSRPADSPRLA